MIFRQLYVCCERNADIVELEEAKHTVYAWSNFGILQLVRCHVTGAESLAESQRAPAVQLALSMVGLEDTHTSPPVTLHFSQILQSAIVNVLCVFCEYECEFGA